MEPVALLRRGRSMRWLIILLLLGTGGIIAWNSVRSGWRTPSSDKHPLEGLKVFGSVLDFTLIERSGKRVGLEDLRGKIWITNFFYSHCTDTCPLQSARMAQLQRAFAGDPDLRLVSITVDPARDTPEVLRQYAQQFHADPEQWLFLTGPRDEIYKLARDGFHLGVGNPVEKTSALSLSQWRLGAFFFPRDAWAHAEDAGENPVLHSPRFVLVDRRAQIRGYYDSREQAALQRLRHDAKILLRK